MYYHSLLKDHDIFFAAGKELGRARTVVDERFEKQVISHPFTDKSKNILKSTGSYSLSSISALKSPDFTKVLNDAHDVIPADSNSQKILLAAADETLEGVRLCHQIVNQLTDPHSPIRRKQKAILYRSPAFSAFICFRYVIGAIKDMRLELSDAWNSISLWKESFMMLLSHMITICLIFDVMEDSRLHQVYNVTEDMRRIQEGENGSTYSSLRSPIDDLAYLIEDLSKLISIPLDTCLKGILDVFELAPLYISPEKQPHHLIAPFIYHSKNYNNHVAIAFKSIIQPDKYLMKSDFTDCNNKKEVRANGITGFLRCPSILYCLVSTSTGTKLESVKERLFTGLKMLCSKIVLDSNELQNDQTPLFSLVLHHTVIIFNYYCSFILPLQFSCEHDSALKFLKDLWMTILIGFYDIFYKLNQQTHSVEHSGIYLWNMVYLPLERALLYPEELVHVQRRGDTQKCSKKTNPFFSSCQFSYVDTDNDFNQSEKSGFNKFMDHCHSMFMLCKSGQTYATLESLVSKAHLIAFTGLYRLLYLIEEMNSEEYQSHSSMHAKRYKREKIHRKHQLQYGTMLESSGGNITLPILKCFVENKELFLEETNARSSDGHRIYKLNAAEDEKKVFLYVSSAGLFVRKEFPESGTYDLELSLAKLLERLDSKNS